MRKIKFRGKRIDCDKIIYGDAFCTRANSVFISHIERMEKVYSETLGQFTGMYDIDGNEIYEDDILQNISFPEVYLQVAWHHGCWIVKSADFDPEGNEYEILYETLRDFKMLVVGNIHENPELLKGATTNES